MSRNVFMGFTDILRRFENFLPQIFRLGGGFYPPALSLGVIDMPIGCDHKAPTPSKLSLKDLIGDGIFWAVPKHRRTVEKRLNRKFGRPEYVWKLIRIRTNLRVCSQCGHDYEVGVLCPHCYNKVRSETQQMQEAIQSNLGLQPVEQEVIVLYEGEQEKQPKEFLNGKRIVEMPKPRPMWFTRNLLQKSTQEPAATKEVKPSNLA